MYLPATVTGVPGLKEVIVGVIVGQNMVEVNVEGQLSFIVTVNN